MTDVENVDSRVAVCTATIPISLIKAENSEHVYWVGE